MATEKLATTFLGQNVWTADSSKIVSSTTKKEASQMLKDGFSTREVLELTGTTARQLQWWDEKRLIVPARDGRRRLYSSQDVTEIHVIEEMRRRHISLITVRRVMRFLRRETGVRLSDIASGRSEWHLLLDGKNVYLETDTQQIVNLIKNTVQPVFVICLSESLRRVNMALPKLHSTRFNRKTVAGKKPTSHVTLQIKSTQEARVRTG